MATRDPIFDGPGSGGSGYTGTPPTAGQGWTVDATANTITFSIAPANLVAIEVNEFTVGTLSGTTKFAIGSWCPAYGWPSEIEFFSDRLWLAGTNTDLQMIWGSEIGNYTSFGRSTPIIDSDAVSFAINSRQVNAVMDLVPLDKMIILAKGGEFLMTGGQDDVVTPSTIAIKPQSYRGSGGVQAKVVGDTAIFVQEQGSRVYDIGYRFEQDGYRPQDVSVWAEHLLEGKTILRMEWMPAPWSILPFVRSDGTLIACTYMPEQEVIGWHRHDTGRNRYGDGVDEIEDIVCLPGTAQTEVIVLVKRVVDGVTVRYLEQLAPAFVEDIRDSIFMDAALTYDGRNAAATTLTLSGGTDWLETEDLTLTASAATFDAGNVGDGFTLTVTVQEVNDDGETVDVDYSVRLEVTAFNSDTDLTVNSVGTVPAELRNVATADWAEMHDTISGLDHLEGRRVSILADGSVVTNGRDGDAYTVTGGEITLPSLSGVVHVGLSFRAHIETLEVNAANGAPLRDAKKLMTGVGLLVKGSRGVKSCGGNFSEALLYDLPQREFEAWGDPTDPLTGYGKIPLSAEWGENVGRVHVVSDDPLPLEILALLPKFAASDVPG